MKRTRCQVPRQSSPSRTGMDSPAGPRSIAMQCEWPLRELDVLGADVLGAPVPVVVGVVLLARDDSAQHADEVLEEAGLEFVHPHAAGGVRGVDAGDAVAHAALGDAFLHFVCDVADLEARPSSSGCVPAGRPSPRAPTSVGRVSGRRHLMPADECARNSPALSGVTLSGAGPVAQRSEQRTHNPLVPGSNPGGPICSRMVEPTRMAA